MFKEFKEFAFKGNVVDMAVGLIIATAFGAVVKSMVDNILMPILGLVTGGVDFSKMAIVLKEGIPASETVKAVEPVLLKYGLFINEIITFIIMAFAVFIVVKKVIASKNEEPAAPPEPTKEELLLAEIRDLLKR